MKKKLLALIFFATLSLTAFGQPYQPMLNNSSWMVGTYDFLGEGSFTIGQTGTSTVGAYTYNRYWDGNNEYLLREDAANRKVYRNKNGNDELLFDFSQNVGGTVYIFSYAYTITNIVNVNVNGGTRRMFLLSNDFFSDAWIEGVGDTNHPLLWHAEVPSDPVYFIKCSTQQGVNIYNKGIADGGAATDCSAILGVDPVIVLAQKIEFAPNPFSSQVTLKSTRSLHNAKLVLINALGQSVNEIDAINGTEISIARDNLNAGIYLTQLFEGNKLIHASKLVIAD
jgi:hypothetical protein